MLLGYIGVNCRDLFPVAIGDFQARCDKRPVIVMIYLLTIAAKLSRAIPAIGRMAVTVISSGADTASSVVGRARRGRQA